MYQNEVIKSVLCAIQENKITSISKGKINSAEYGVSATKKVQIKKVQGLQEGGLEERECFGVEGRHC